MATMIENDTIPSYTRTAIDSTLSPEDFETASIRSAAPSYTSDAPSYHTLNPHPDPSPLTPPLPHLPPHLPPPPVSSSSSSSQETLRRVMLERIEEEESRRRIRPLEDPYLVGEEAAARARQERLARQNGDDVLIRENRRWDWFLRQMREREEREERMRRLGGGGEQQQQQQGQQQQQQQHGRGLGFFVRGGRGGFRVGGRS
ncbi:hypothetical protein B0T21DRAFT_454021 [Apiosordaria backusii]|uniref:Uncharacterized protein n=1 Tax=Apiosordaria backusii TaxID=314023 RepID=A0AA40DX51_9PEZI|nr:hypothetical protein B0T21DRAFT_454021 [Apiosordaria backusii]